MDLTTLTGEALTAALAVDFSAADNDALAAALAEQRKAGDALFALTEPTIAQVKDAVAIKTSVKSIEAEQAERAEAVKAAVAEFAAARAEFALDAEDGDDEGDDEGDDTDEDGEVDETDAEGEGDGEIVEASADDEGDESDDDKKKDDKPVVTASGSQKINAGAAARRVGKQARKPARKAATNPVTITASSDIPGFDSGSRIKDHSELAKAFIARAKGIPQFNLRAGERVREITGGAPEIKPLSLASFDLNLPDSLVASGKGDAEYKTMQAAIKDHTKALSAALKTSQGGGTDLPSALSAAGWCAPSEPVYSYIADYKVDGLVTLAQVGAPRGGLLTTTGPQRSSQGSALDDFGFTQTETEAEAGMVKTLESIECPDFVDHRLDAIGYGFTIPFLTQKAYPELIADTLKFAGVLWQHKMNRRRINNLLSLSDAKTFEGYGPSTTDTLEVLSLIAIHERRKWNLGENAVMEVKLPTIAREVFRSDMSRRSGLSLDDVATDQKINAHFAARNLAVEYLSDWAEISYDGAVVLPGSFPAMIYPSGTFVEALEDVVNLSAIYDAASITVNEYTGVFFEQGHMIFKAGYGSTKITIPVNTAGESGALTLTGSGDKHENGSF